MSPRLSIPHRKVAAFCRRWEVAQLSLFGSVLSDGFRPDSDIDVLVKFQPGTRWSLSDLLTMQEELGRLFGREVDLVEEDGLRNPFRRQAILGRREIIYAA